MGRQSSRVLYVCQITRGEKRSASRRVPSIFCCASVTVNWTLNDQFGSERACDQWANGGNTNVLSLWCKSAETGSDSLSFRPAARLLERRKKTEKEKERSLINARQCVCTCVDMEEVGTPQEDFRFFMVRTCCGKIKKNKRSQAEHVHVHMRTRESPSGTHLHHWMLHIFYWTHFLREVASIVSVRCSLISWKKGTKRKEKKKHTADYCQSLCFDILMKPNTTE